MSGTGGLLAVHSSNALQVVSQRPVRMCQCNLTVWRACQVCSKLRMVAQEKKYWEDSFRVYEKGVAAFKYPHVKDIWQAYLAQFVQRYGGTKLERARDLFRQALNEVSQVRHDVTAGVHHVS